MKYILIPGTKDAGKSTTIDAVCKRLNPIRVERLTGQRTLEPIDSGTAIHNGTYILEVNGKIILVAAGAPTEQGITITILIEIVIKIKLRIDFAIVAMRSYERSEGFDTRNELKALGECLLEKEIWQVPGPDFIKDPAWIERIELITSILTTNIL